MFTVIWKTAVLDRLAELYVAGSVDERERMAAGIAALNSRLANDPTSVGEGRTDGDRVAFPPLLVVSFRIDTARQVVRVLSVARYGH